MSAQPLQERILGVVRNNQPLREAELHKWLKDVDVINLDVGVRALMRANRISLIGGHYDLVEVERPAMQKAPVVTAASTRRRGFATPPCTLNPCRCGRGCTPLPLRAEQPTTTPSNGHPWDRRVLPGDVGSETPSAIEEAAAALEPQTSQVFPCERCHEPQPNGAYRHSSLGKRFNVCKRCDAELRGFVSRKSPVEVSMTDCIASKLRAQVDQLSRDIQEHGEQILRFQQQVSEQRKLLEAKRIALGEINELMSKLAALVPEAFT